MKLSIGMIVKNESRNLRACLNCLRPILSQVDSELIIADTGSADDTVSIAGDFTAHVLRVPWRDDFAQARNHTVRAARGEWFMFLDADEFFEETGDLARFFNSGEYTRYNSATYRIRSRASIFDAPRMVKRTKETCFQGIIHEYLPFEPPCKNLSSCARHTGYDFDDDPDMMRRKHERNIALMMKIYARDPSDLRNIALITNEYMGLRALDECKPFIDMGIEKVGNNSSHPLFHFFYHKLAFYYLLRETPEGLARTVDTVRAYLSLRKQPSITSIDMYYYMGSAYYQCQNYTAAADALQHGYDLIKAYLAGRLNMDEAAVVVSDYANETGFRQVAAALADCYAKAASRFSAGS